MKKMLLVVVAATTILCSAFTHAVPTIDAGGLTEPVFVEVEQLPMEAFDFDLADVGLTNSGTLQVTPAEFRRQSQLVMAKSAAIELNQPTIKRVRLVNEVGWRA